MQSILLMALLGAAAGEPATPGARILPTPAFLEGQWAPKNDPQGCQAANGPKFLPGQRIPTPTGDAIPYRLLPKNAGIAFTDWDGQKIAYLIKVLSEHEMQVETTYNGLSDEFDEPVIHRRCQSPRT